MWNPYGIYANKSLQDIMKITRNYSKGFGKMQDNSDQLQKQFSDISSSFKAARVSHPPPSERAGRLIFYPTFPRKEPKPSQRALSKPEPTYLELPDEETTSNYQNALAYPTYGASRFYDSQSITEKKLDMPVKSRRKVDRILHVGKFRPTSSTKRPQNFAKYHGLI